MCLIYVSFRQTFLVIYSDPKQSVEQHHCFSYCYIHSMQYASSLLSPLPSGYHSQRLHGQISVQRLV